MATKKKTSEPATEEVIQAEWFPVYGIRVKGWGHIFASGQDEAKALANFAGLMASEGKRLNKDFRAVFLNEPFEVE